VAPVVVYGELMPQFQGNTVLLNEFLNEHRIEINPLSIDAVTDAAKSWMQYLKRKEKNKCPNCGHLQASKAHFLSDFFIGGYALAECDAILTRDRGIYRKYFPGLLGYENCLGV